MKKKALVLIGLMTGAMALSGCSFIDNLSNFIPDTDNGGNNNSNGQSNYTCPSCNESFVDQPDHEGPCQYEAETCKLCQRDVMLEYINDFNTHGATTSDPILLVNEQEMISLGHYVHLNRCCRYFKVNYTIPNSLSLINYENKVLSKLTDATCGRHFGTVGADIGYFENTDEEFENNYKAKSGTDYTELISEELENPIDEIFLGKGNRAETFDDFKIYNRKYELNVRTGDDLFYACTHGYKPKPAAGSNAEVILNKIKEILRENINDTMNDFEKAFTMYCWLIKNVQYDNGAVVATDYGAYKGKNTQLAAWGIEGTIFEHKAICDSLSKTYAVFMGMENIKCIQISGNAHAWNKIYLNLDGEFRWYVVDPTFGNGELDDYEAASHSEFLYDDKTKEDEHYAADNYLDAVASKDIVQYKYIKYDGTNDMFIENDLELNHYIQHIGPYVKALHNDGKPVSIEVAFPTSGVGAYTPSTLVFKQAVKTYCDWNPDSFSFSRSEFTGYSVYSYTYEA